MIHVYISPGNAHQPVIAGLIAEGTPFVLRRRENVAGERAFGDCAGYWLDPELEDAAAEKVRAAYAERDVEAIDAPEPKAPASRAKKGGAKDGKKEEGAA